MQQLFKALNRKHLIGITNKDVQKKLFRNSIITVEIEIFSYCNRKCWFCPNSSIDRHSTNHFMPEELYLKVLKELQSIGYSQNISYSRYNEPLADKIFLTRLEQAHYFLPNARLHTNTNGDFLTQEYLEELYEAGLRSLNVQIYLTQNDIFSDQLIEGKINALSKKLNLPYEKTIYIPNEWYEINFSYKDMQIRSYARNFHINSCDRGGLLNLKEQRHVRTSPCESPFLYFYIDYNGNVMPCCNLRSDSEAHQPYILGSISNSTLFEIYASKKASSFRKNLYHISEKNGVCLTCDFVEFILTAEDLKKINQIQKQDLFLNWL